MEYSVRLELARICSLNGFQLVMDFYGVDITSHIETS